MAEFIQYGGNNGGSFASHFTCKLTVWEISYDIASNSSSVGYRLELISGSSGRFSDLKASFKVCLDSQGSPQYKEGSGTYSSQSYNTAQTICEGTRTVYHNSDGTKNIGCWASLDFESNTYSPGDFSPSGYMDLTTIPRYAEFNGHRTEITGVDYIQIAYNSNKTLVGAEYSLNGGSWTPLTIISGQWNQPNNTVIYQISNLKPNTVYQVRTRIAHVSGLWTYSNTLSISTRDIARISTLNDFMHGDKINVVITNPGAISGLNLVMNINNEQILSRNVAIGNNEIVFSDEELDSLYQKYGSSSNLIATFVLTGKEYTDSKTCNIMLTGNQKTIRTNQQETWKRAKVWINIEDLWKRGVIYKKINGSWKRGI